MKKSDSDIPIRMLFVELRIVFCKNIEITKIFRIMPNVASGKLIKPCVCVEYILSSVLDGGVIWHSISEA
jgi:hypothetical protein